MSGSVPQTKEERRRRRAMTRFAALVFRSVRRVARRLDVLDVQVQSTRDGLIELRGDVQEVAAAAAEARRWATQAKALYYDTHCTITGEHVDHGEGVAHHVGGGAFDDRNDDYDALVELRAELRRLTDVVARLERREWTTPRPGLTVDDAQTVIAASYGDALERLGDDEPPQEPFGAYLNRRSRHESTDD